MAAEIEFQWDGSLEAVAEKKTGGKAGMLFLANEAARLMDPYVPADNLVLAQNVRIDADKKSGGITYLSPYAHYQYEGEVYGPNYPIVDGNENTGWRSPSFKTPTGKKLQYSTFRHPLATSHWDKAMMTARKHDLLKAYESYLKGRSR